MNVELIKLLQDYCGADPHITESTRLFHDLDLYGDDAAEFFDRFKDRFTVDMCDFCFADYFPNEGDWILPTILRFLIGRPQPIYRPLTVSDLQLAIDCGYLQ
ncbi:DUF1493 family protein [Sphingobacterium faecale]|uniref:DUF1493 family protein n=1 Tax=Sphingobacterium faecale TaxID=2803775 RepID=A0ABS1RA78_9SPHI|nr:DUF1493 family protein [Sphingobacterium faecale]MBL1411573.1 DUF1493 family protein [Sphingobacterium faecale]